MDDHRPRVGRDLDDVVQAAVLAPRRARIDQVLAARTRSLALVLENIHDSHNLSAVLRSAEGFGVQEVHVIETSGPLEVSSKITQGCHKWLDLVPHPDAQTCVQHLRARGYELWAATLDPSGVSLTEVPFGRPLALVLGNESLGISSELLRLCNGRFRIAMSGFVQSFNLSVAAAITLFYATLPAKVYGGGVPRGLLPDDEADLRRRWLALSIKQGPRIRQALAALGEAGSTAGSAADITLPLPTQDGEPR